MQLGKILLYSFQEQHAKAVPLMETFLESKEDGDYHVHTVLHHVICALHYYALARRTGQGRYIRKTKPHVRPWKILNRQYASINSKAMLALLKADKLATRKQPDAPKYFQEAIPLLQKGKIYSLEAFAHERLASLLQSKVAARESYETAIAKYEAYGAYIKVSRMKERLEAFL